jgi:hypothetical protein
MISATINIFIMEEVSKISSYRYTFANSRFEREYYLSESEQLGDRLQSSSGNEICI